ncbi:MAG: primase-helicase family protein [Chitinophagaceae bacterium]
MPDLNYPLNTPDSYIRVQTNYYKKCLQPTIHGEYKEIWMPWSAEMLKQDLTKSAFRKVQKFDGFSCVPSHLHFQETIGNFYNLYQPLEWKAEPGSCDTILNFLRHIFDEQYDLGLDYLSLLYTNPTQKLPVLCLVSSERKTGKTTFLNLLKLIFGRNMTFNGNSDFRSQFNSDWMNMLIIAVDEVLLDRKEDSEKIKNLSTARTSKTEAKNKDRKEIEFFGKFVLCSNNEENFIVIDPTETRYWIRKIPVLMSENIRLLQDMEKEINHFLYYLLQRPLSVPQGLTRMWFSEKQLRTDALLRVIRNNRNKVETEILLLFKEIFEATNAQELFFANKDILELLKKNVPRLSRQNIAAVLQQEWKMEPVSNSLSYQTYIYNLSNELVPVHYTGRYYTITWDWIEQKFDESS